MTQVEVTVPITWKPPPWLSKPGFSKRELQWLCERLDASNRELRIENRELRAKLAQGAS